MPLTVYKRDSRAIRAAFANTVEITSKKLGTANLKTLFDNLRGKLVHAILRGISNDMINCAATVGWHSVLTDVLDAPITELAARHYINAREDLVDTRTLHLLVSKKPY